MQDLHLRLKDKCAVEKTADVQKHAAVKLLQ